MKKIFHRFSAGSNLDARRWDVSQRRGIVQLRFAVGAFAVILSTAGGIFLLAKIAQAATYNFNQSSWVGGATANTATHTSNQTGWTQYSSATTTIATTTVSIQSTSYSFTDDGATSTTPALSGSKGGGFSNGTLQNVAITGSGTAANIGLFPVPTGARLDYAVGAGPFEVAFDNVTNSLWVANNGANTVSKVNVSTGTKVDYPTGVGPRGVAFDPITNSVWVANYGAGSGSTVSKIDINTGTKVDYPVNAGPIGMAFDPVTNSMWVTNYASSTVSKVNVTNGTRVDYTSGGLNPGSLAFDTVTNSMWVSNYGGVGLGNIGKINIMTGAVTNYVGVTNPFNIIFDPLTSSVWTASYGTALLSKFNVTTGAKIADYATPASPTGVAYDPSSGAVWAISRAGNSISKYDATTGTLLGTYSVGSYPNFVIYEPITASMWITNNTANTVSKLSTGSSYYAPAGTKIDYAVGANPISSTIDPVTNSVWVTNYTSNTISKINLTTGTRVDYATGVNPQDCAFDPVTNSIWIADFNGNGPGSVSKMNIFTGTKVDYPVVTGSVGVAFDPITNSVWVTSYGSNQVSKINIFNGTRVDYAVGATPEQAAFDPITNSVWVANYWANNGISLSKMNVTTGARVDYNTGGNSPVGVAFDSITNSIWATNWSSASVSKMNPTTGGVIAMYTVGVNPAAISTDTGTRSIWVSNNGSNTISKMDPTTGTRVDYPTGVGPEKSSFDSVGNYVWVAGYTSNIVSRIAVGTTTATGIFTSAVIDTGASSSFTTLSYTKTVPTNTGLTMDVRAGNTATPDGTWTAWVTNVASGGSITSLAGNRYVQYRANFSTTSVLSTPVLSDVTINYALGGTSGTLMSSKYDSTDPTNTIAKISWNATGTTTTETLKFQVRSSPDGSTWSNWCGPSTACLGTDYFQDADNGVALAAGHPLKTGGNDRYLQYQAFLTAGTVGLSPVITSVTPQYVVNAAPNFDTTYGTNGTNVTQVATSTDPNWGKVTIGYSVRDTDTATGTVNPGFITPSFEYSTNSGSTWTAIPAADLAVGDTANKIVNGTLYNIYTATWTASSTLANTYNASMKVRVTVNDNEGSNNTAQAVSALFALDTKAPTIGAGNAILDSSTGVTTGTLTLTATDNSQLQYRYCNNNTFPTTDTQGNSCAWSALATTFASTTTTWTPVGAPGNETVYLQVRDALGNVTAQTIVSPATLSSFVFRDISNINIGAFWEFLSWGVATNTTGSAFSAYKLYTSTDGTNYSVLATITDPALNYYRDNITTATTSLHYYKALTVDTDSDVSHFTNVVSDVPNGTGGTDTTPPVISNIAVPAGNIKNTSAQVTFTTDKLTQATVQYRVSGQVGWNTVSNISYLTNQSVYLTGLIPNTTYNIQVKAVDVFGNTSAYVAGPNFTTVGGPVITNVTVSSLTDVSATIFWNTSTSSNSYVYYSTSASLASPSSAGSATLVSCVGAICQHQVTISGLTAGRQYYYYVSSTDGVGNATTDTNNSAYYTFTTTLDTTPPVLSAISTPVVAPKQAVVVWKTDEPATSQVLYGTTTGTYPKYSVTDMTMSIYHVVTLSSQTTNGGAAGGTNELTPTTPYFFVVKSADVAGNTATSPEQTFTTPSTGDVTIVAVSIVNTAIGSGTGTTTAVPDTTPPIISNIKATSVDSFNETITFTTNENAVSFVDLGKDTSYGSNFGDPTLIQNHSTKLTNLQMGTTYHFRIKAIDAAGNMTTSDDQTFKTPFTSEKAATTTVDETTLLQSQIEDLVTSALPSLSAPFITKPVITNITEHGATISWTTNVKAYGQLNYSEDTEFKAKNGIYASNSSSGATRQTTHSVELTNLKSNALYHIQATGYVFQQVVGKSDDTTFSTKPAQIQGSVAERTKNSFTIVWTTDEPASSIIEYKDVATGRVERSVDQPMTTAHSVKVDNLPSGVTYTVNISGVNKEGNTIEAANTLSVTTSVDVIPPVISGFRVDGALVPGRTDRIQTVVSWKTDEPADSVVYYEEGAGTLGETKELANKVAVTGNYIQNHSIILANLKPGTIYRIKITSADDSGNRASFGPRTIITPQQTQSITDVIFKNFEDSFKFLRQL